ncbi:MAG: chitin deacetylase [Firmicutes bacterium]|nr:chitin deacetylase [Bacillota bacterium]
MKGFHVLMYHEIIKKEDFDIDNKSNIKVNQDYQDVLPKPLFVFLKEFKKQMRYLYENDYTTLELKDIIDFLYNNKPLPKKSVLLTFDDMYKSVLLYAYPILKKYNFNAVGFVVLDWLFNKEKEYSNSKSVCLSKKELEKISDVFEYANHTKRLHTRRNGLTASQTIDKLTFFKDVKACDEFVDVKKVFAYPFGIFTEDVLDWLKELEFLLAFTTESGKNSIKTNPLKIHRNGVFLNYDLDDFKKILID